MLLISSEFVMTSDVPGLRRFNFQHICEDTGRLRESPFIFQSTPSAKQGKNTSFSPDFVSAQTKQAPVY